MPGGIPVPIICDVYIFNTSIMNRFGQIEIWGFVTSRPIREKRTTHYVEPIITLAWNKNHDRLEFIFLRKLIESFAQSGVDIKTITKVFVGRQLLIY